MVRIIPTCSALALLLAASVPPAAAAARTGDLAAYLRARAADADGRGKVAVENYAAALAAEPDSPLIAIRAYREGIAAGDGALVRRAAAVLRRADVSPMDAPLFPLADAVRANDPAAARAALAALNEDRLKLLTPALTGWIALAEGRDGPAAIEAAGGDAAARRLSGESRALLLLATGKLDEGLAAVRALGGGEIGGFRTAAAEILIGADRAKDAAELLDGDAFALAAARAGATARPGMAWGVSRLLLRVADDMGGDQPSSVALALARAALDADPNYARAHFVLAEQLGRSGDLSRAVAQLDAVPADGPLGPAAAGRRVDLLSRQDKLADALAAARVLAEAEDARPLDQARYADLLFADDRPAEALPWYERVLDEGQTKKNWAAWLRYGGALDEAGRWKEALRALDRAVKLGPEEPSALNYLGYTLVDRGEDVARGTRLLERAHALDRNDPAIADSLGWAYYRAGDTARALPLIEGAAAEAPGDAEIAEHLGDLYWTLGRRYEARYQWRAAAVTAPDAAAARLRAKLESGLPAS